MSCESEPWKLEDAAAFITFCRGAVKQPLMVTCSLWSPKTLSPPLGSNEVLVSNVIELSHDGPPDLQFSGDATVALLHSASNLRGYEVVIKQLVDPENNEWKDLLTKNIWHTSGTLVFVLKLNAQQVILLKIKCKSWTIHKKSIARYM